MALLGAKSPLFRIQFVLIVMAVAVTATYLVTKIYAASGTLSLTPSVATVNIGDTVVVQVRENSGSDPVNAVEADLTFDSTRLQYVGLSESSSAFGLVAQTTSGTGTLALVRSTTGGAAPLTGDNLVTSVTFKALAVGTVNVMFANTSALLRSTDNTNILSVKNGSILTLADTSAPTIPSALAAPTRNLSSIGLTWAASTDNVGVTGYRVYRNGALVGTTTSEAFTDTSLTPNTSYTYTVTALDAANNVSMPSSALVVSTLADTTAPTVPSQPISATQTITSISLSWTGSTDNVGVTGYRLYRNGTQITSLAALSYTDTGLAVNTSYSYTVAAFDAAGNVSAQSAAKAVATLADTQAPTVPVNVSSNVTGRNVALTWTASTDNVAVTAYLIFLDGTQIASSSTANYTVVNATQGSHVYTIAAKDAAGNISAKSTGVTVVVYLASDVNKDGKVDIYDVSIVLSNWGRTGANVSDINGDGVINVYDLSTLLSNWTG